MCWEEFVARINNELLANWGNLVNRMLSFAYRRYEQRVPAPAVLDASDEALLAVVRGGFESVGSLYAACKFKAALAETQRLSQEVNRYLNDKEPWKTIKTDAQAAATSVYVALQAIDWLKTLYSPVLPHTSQLVHEYLGYDGQLWPPGDRNRQRRPRRTSGAALRRQPGDRPLGAGQPARGPGAARTRGAVQETGRERGRQRNWGVSAVEPATNHHKARPELVGLCS